MALPTLTPNQIEQIARIMGGTEKGFTGYELGHHLAQCRMDDPDPTLTKWKRLYNAFGAVVNASSSTNVVYQFIQYCMEPAQGLQNPDRYNWMRLEINKVLMLVGIEIKDGESIEGYGNEMWIDGKEKSISRSTIERAMKTALKMGGKVPGPKALNVPGAHSYLYPIFVRFGVIES